MAADALTDRGEVRRLLKEAGVRPSKRLGQNFLVNPAIVRDICDAACAFSPARIVEIGSGLGAVTRALADIGPPVLGIEVDHRLAAHLETVTNDLDNVHIRRCDALDFPFDVEGVDETLVVGSIPYSITAPLLKHLVDHRRHVVGAVLVTQREVAEKVAASPGTEGSALGILVQAYADMKILGRIGRGAFLPVPDVDSTLWMLRFLPAPRFRVDEDVFFRVVRAAYGQRRKMLRGALRTLASAEDVIEALDAAGIDPARRGETLSIAELDRLAAALNP